MSSPPKEPGALRRMAIGAAIVATLGTSAAAQPQAQPQSALVDVLASGKRSKELRALTQSTQASLRFNKPFEKWGVGNDALVKGETIAATELMLTALQIGRTSVTVWFKDGTVEQYMFDVRRDLSVLETALRNIHPSIEADIAPDRDAVILTGNVPDSSFSVRAASAAQDYVSAGRSGSDAAASGKVINLIRVESALFPLETRIQSEVERLGVQGATFRRVQQGVTADDTKDVFVLGGQVPTVEAADRALGLARASIGADDKTKRLVNQLQVMDRPTAIESVIEKAIHEQVGCPKVVVQRVANADVSGDMDILVLTGSVPNQTKLVQALTIASKVFQQQELVRKTRAGEFSRVTETFAGGLTRTTDEPLTLKNATEDIKVSSDESGALFSKLIATSSTSSGLGSLLSGGEEDVSTGITENLLTNRLESNIARAKAIEIADGRIVSFVTVDTIQQVRVDVRYYEVSRSALIDFDSNLKASAADNNAAFTDINGDPIPPPSSNVDVKNVLSFLSGTLGNQLTVNGDHFAVDSLLTLLETEGIAKTLSNPSLTVLSGEVAAFADGGRFFIPQTIANANFTQESTEAFRFGVLLAVRPLADESGFVTLDVAPSITQIDADLTAEIRLVTGTTQRAPALKEQSMKTSSRLNDGGLLFIGGLTQHSRSDAADKTPWLSSVPILGWLFKDFSYEDNDKELVIVVSPAIVRDRPTDAFLWCYPSADELLGRLPPPPPPEEQDPQQQPPGTPPPSKSTSAPASTN